MKVAPDFWTSKTTWTAIAATIAGVSAIFAKQADPAQTVMGIFAAWMLAFHRDATVKAINATAPGVPAAGGN